LSAVEVTVKLALASGLFVIAIGTSGCATAAGISTSEDAGTSPSVDAAKDTGQPKKVPEEASTPTNDSGGNDATTPPSDSTCAAESTQNDCEQCCLTVHPEGYSVYNAALTPCVCTSPGACTSECQSELCSNQPVTPGDACDTCITAALDQNTGACYNAVATACQGDSDCTDLFGTCIPPCESL
jgi:hypothetical protein